MCIVPGLIRNNLSQKRLASSYEKADRRMHVVQGLIRTDLGEEA